MAFELLIRFFFGGLVVSAFALAGELFKPKTFSGMFSAAPSVALVTLALAYAKHGRGYVALEGRSMVLGALALLAYAAACVGITKRHSIPVWLGAGAAWAAWLAVAFTLWGAAVQAGVLR